MYKSLCCLSSRFVAEGAGAGRGEKGSTQGPETDLWIPHFSATLGMVLDFLRGLSAVD